MRLKNYVQRKLSLQRECRKALLKKITLEWCAHESKTSPKYRNGKQSLKFLQKCYRPAQRLLKQVGPFLSDNTEDNAPGSLQMGTISAIQQLTNTQRRNQCLWKTSRKRRGPFTLSACPGQETWGEQRAEHN